MKKHLRSMTTGIAFCAAALLASAAGFAQTPGTGKDAPKAVEPQPEGAAPARIMVITLKGEIGRDVSKTPIQRIMADAKRQKPDYLVFKVDCAYAFHGKTLADWQADPRMTSSAFQQLETIRELDQYFTDQIRDDKEWTANIEGGKPKLVMWVNRALGGAAFLPWVAPDIFFTSDGKMGGLAYLEFIFGNMGDADPRAKQFSLRVARAKGLAEKGGHDARLVMAMCETYYVLSVSYVGGKPVFFENDSGEEIIKDDGDPKKGRNDDVRDVMRGGGNDFLNFDPAKAYKLGVSRGTVDTVAEMANELGVARNYIEVKGSSEKILKAWSEEVTAAELEFRRLFREFNKIPIEGNNSAARNQGRSKRLGVLNKVKDLLKKYGEAVNPNEIQGAPEQWNTQIDLIIEQIKLQMRLDK